jgi:hypothetical protein
MCFSGILVYNFDRILFFKNDARSNPERSKYIKQNYEFISFLVLVSLFAIISALQYIDFSILFFAFFLFILTMIYFYLYNQKKTSFELSAKFKIHNCFSVITGFFKPVVIGFVWSSGTVVVPVLSHPVFLKSPSLWIYFLIRFSEYVLNGFLFDYRDKTGDKLTGKINIFNSWRENKIISALMITAAGLIIITGYFLLQGFIHPVFVSDLIILLVYLFILYSIYNPKMNFLNIILRRKIVFTVVADLILFLPVLFSALMFF